jgi:hypothetical protein
MRLVIPRSTCVLFQDLHGHLLEVVQFLSASRIACANSGASAGQTAHSPLSYSVRALQKSAMAGL